MSRRTARIQYQGFEEDSCTPYSLQREQRRQLQQVIAESKTFQRPLAEQSGLKPSLRLIVHGASTRLGRIRDACPCRPLAVTGTVYWSLVANENPRRERHAILHLLGKEKIAIAIDRPNPLAPFRSIAFRLEGRPNVLDRRKLGP